MTFAAAPRLATLEDWLDAPEDRRLELIDGELVQKTSPSLAHGLAQGQLREELGPFARRPGDPRGPGGWWLATEVDILLGADVFRPDLVGWRRERMPTLPEGRPVTLRPDWIAEVVSESNRGVDLVKKLRKYQRAGVPHYWLVDPSSKSLTVLRCSADGYAVVLVAEAGERVRAEPFEALELDVGAMFGD